MSEFDKGISQRIKDELNRRNMKQSQLVAGCREIGMPISQSDISKICSGSKSLSAYQLASISRVLGLSIDFLTWGKDNHREDFCDPHDSETLSDGSKSNKEMESYEGDFHMYYLSTADGEDKILHSTLHVGKQEEFYSLQLDLNTGIRDINGKDIIKSYTGRFLISASLGAAYLILKNEVIGEICMICMRHRNYNIKNVECRIGLALTVSAGEVKVPTAHKVLLFRRDLDEKTIGSICPLLQMSGNDIHIDVEKFKRIIEETTKENPEQEEELSRLLEYTAKKEVYDVSIDVLRRQTSLGREKFAYFVARIYREAENDKNYKIQQADDLRIYESLQIQMVEAETGGRGSPLSKI